MLRSIFWIVQKYYSQDLIIISASINLNWKIFCSMGLRTDSELFGTWWGGAVKNWELCWFRAEMIFCLLRMLFWLDKEATPKKRSVTVLGAERVSLHISVTWTLYDLEKKKHAFVKHFLNRSLLLMRRRGWIPYMTHFNSQQPY